MSVKDFSNEMYSSALKESDVNNTNIDVELAKRILDIMQESGDVASFELCPFKRGHNAKLTAYSYNDEMQSIDLFVFSKAATPAGKVDADTVMEYYSCVEQFYREALKTNPFFGVKLPYDVVKATRLIKEEKSDVKRLRLFF